jgi:hypothetical protein
MAGETGLNKKRPLCHAMDGNKSHKHGGRGMIVASSLDRGKTDILVKLASDLTAFVRKSVQEGASLDDMERGAFAFALDIGRSAVELFLKGQGDGDLGPEVSTEKGMVLQRSETVVDRPLRTIFGEHTVAGYVYSKGAKTKIELRPIDARINLPEGKASYLLQEFTQLFCVEKAFGVGARQFETVFEQKLSVDVLEDINRGMGKQADRFLDQLPTPPASKEGAILVTTADGKGVPLVKEDAQKVPAFDKKERPGNRRMATLGCVYTVDPFVRTPEQIVAALFRDNSVPQPTERPKACFKHYRAFFAEAGPEGRDAVPSAYRTWAWIGAEAKTRHQFMQRIVRLMDGQPSLWDASDACLDEWVAELRERGQAQPLVDILDIIHVSSYVWKVAKTFCLHKEHQEAYVQERLLRILRGDVTGVITGMRRMASLRNLKGEALKTVRTTCNYFENNAHRMRYDEYLNAGYPIATGVIEGACRHVIKDRMEQGGMRWTLEGAQAMLNVRSVLASSESKRFSQWRQTEEAERVHPHRALVETLYVLAA